MTAAIRLRAIHFPENIFEVVPAFWDSLLLIHKLKCFPCGVHGKTALEGPHYQLVHLLQSSLESGGRPVSITSRREVM